ncbi:phage terminase, small subunit [Pseudomonas aeruginosa]|nr:phage terminase, small subunit [Pseudomonas aeruginosa]
MWNQLGPQLVAAKVLQVVDLYSLEQLCFAWQCFRKKARADMEATAAEQTALKALFSEFGMTPASRRKVSSAGEKQAGNQFAKNGRRGA